MKWTRLTIKTTTTAEDIIISEMYELGLMGAQIEDNVPLTAWEREQMFVDILPETREDDGRALLHFFVEVKGENADAQGFSGNGVSKAEDNSYRYVSGENVVEDLPGLISAMEEKLSKIQGYMDIGEGTIEVSETEDLDWANNWKEFFKPFYVDELMVVPSWYTIGEEGEHSVALRPSDKLLRIDPGSAFGTGMHETTQLCIKALKKYVTEETTLLDVGTGSGILGIVALLYGAKTVTGTDLDICAKEAVKDNLALNHTGEDRFTLLIGNVITEESVQQEVLSLAKDAGKGYDIVVANILAPVLCELTPVVSGKLLRSGGIYITSGIIEGKEESVSEACRKVGMEVVSVEKQGEWRCVIARKP
ncbi:MAG: 50S ribosomal protein L11 methyltransferase [Lachnospiraceae bacterium]|nr:50S ribosomal protein L11 methyltransferase [Lachnospiraceae bacterium]